MSGSPFTFFFFSRFGPSSSSSLRIIAASARHESLKGRNPPFTALGSITTDHFLLFFLSFFFFFPTTPRRRRRRRGRRLLLTTANANWEAHF